MTKLTPTTRFLNAQSAKDIMIENKEKNMWIESEEGGLINLNHALCIFVRKSRIYKSDYEVCCEMPSSGEIYFECNTDPNIYLLLQGEKSMCEKYLKEIEELLGIYE